MRSLKLHHILWVCLLIGSYSNLSAQNNGAPGNLNGWPSQGFSATISEADLKFQIGFLASDSLKGRKPGMEEERIAATYIRDVFAKAGLTFPLNNGFQEFTIVADIVPGKNNSLSLDGSDLKFAHDFTPLSFSSNTELNASAVFVGFGFDIDLDSLKWNDYAGLDVKGKWVVILRGDPEPENNNSVFIPFAQERSKALTAKDKGAAGVLFVTPHDMDKVDTLMHVQFDKTPSDAGIPVINITRAVANQILASMDYNLQDLIEGIKTNHSPSSLYLPVTIKATTDLVKQKVQTSNIIAVIKGNDPVLCNEYIVIGAHYDHLGLGGENSGSRVPDEIAVHNGADDNASGTAGLLELAQYLNSNRNILKRSIMFVAFAGEEMGLLGSREFVRNPPVSLKSIKAMINMDMIGRLNPASNTISVGGTGTSTESDTLVAALSTNRPFLVKRSPDGYGPSDHASFYSENIPVFYFTTGAHEDYHTPSDDIDRLNLQGEVAILSMIAELVQMVATRPESLVFKEAGSKQAARYGRNMKVTLGIIPDMVSGDNNGLRVDGTRKGGPAEKAGILKGDVIISLDGQPVTNIYDYMTRLGKIKPGQVAGVEIIREGKKEVLIVQF
jgi:hypothetical protein